MLRLAASLQKASHSATNDWVVVMLVLITGVLTLFQFLGILGFIGKGALHPDDPHVGLSASLLDPLFSRFKGRDWS